LTWDSDLLKKLLGFVFRIIPEQHNQKIIRKLSENTEMANELSRGFVENAGELLEIDRMRIGLS
jgi:hypothetical protein